MKCLMFGLACDQEQFARYTKEHGSPYSVAHYLFEKKMIEEMEAVYSIDHNYILQSSNRSIKHAWIERKRAKITHKTFTTYLCYLNLPIIKFLSLFLSTVSAILRYHKENKGNFFVMSTINYFPVALATTMMSRILKYKNVAIFTDCSVGYAYDKAEKRSISSTLRGLYKAAVHGIEGKYDAYILFSEPMNELVNPARKPWCLMEGFFNPDALNLEKVKKLSPFTIVYAGTIIESVGLQNLVQAFQYIEKEDVELRIYGGGDYKETLQKMSKDDPRIHFEGFIDHVQLFEIEKAASLLVNVRDPELPYTKYSFPSKTFEYLASGTPFLSTKLGCYPIEYDNYIVFIKDNDPHTIAQKLNQIMNTSADDLEQFGTKAQQFAISQKNPKVQISKLVDFIELEIKNG